MQVSILWNNGHLIRERCAIVRTSHDKSNIFILFLLRVSQKYGLIYVITANSIVFLKPASSDV
jgi:hypothetical protein